MLLHLIIKISLSTSEYTAYVVQPFKNSQIVTVAPAPALLTSHT